MSIEPRIESVEKEQEELKGIVTALSGMIANLYSTTWKTEPLSPSRQKEIESNINSITKYLSQESRLVSHKFFIEERAHHSVLCLLKLRFFSLLMLSSTLNTGFFQSRW